VETGGAVLRRFGYRRRVIPLLLTACDNPYSHTGERRRMRSRSRTRKGWRRTRTSLTLSRCWDALAVLLAGEVDSLALFDLETLTWTLEVPVPLEEGEWADFLTTTPDAPPVLRVFGGTSDRLYVLEGDALVPHPVDWLLPLLEWEGGTALSIGADRAVWQVWGDGVPLQVRAFGAEASSDVPGAGSRPLYPSGVLLAEGEILWESAYHQESLAVFTADGVADAKVPAGVWPKASLPDGGGIAAGDLVGFAGDQGYRRGLVTRDAEGDWRLDPWSCALTDYQGALYVGGGRVVRYLGDRPFRLEGVVLGGE
jgi:hypothetical protein